MAFPADDDTANCGACGQVCPQGSLADTPYCLAGVCKLATTLAAESGIVGLAVDGDWIYFTNAQRGTVERIAAAGGGPPSVIASGQPSPRAIAAGGGFVYFANDGTPGDAGPDAGAAGSVIRVAADGSGSPQILASSIAGVGPIALDADRVLFGDDTSLRSVPAAGGSVSVLAPGIPKPLGIATYSDAVYTADYTGGTKVPRASTAPSRYANGLFQGAGIAIGGTTLYLCDTQDNPVFGYGPNVYALSLSTGKGGYVPFFMRGGYCKGLAADASSVFWITAFDTNGNNTVSNGTTDGKSHELASSASIPLGTPTAIAQAGDSVYVVASGNLLRVPK
jgi:hypothetical protein